MGAETNKTESTEPLLNSQTDNKAPDKKSNDDGANKSQLTSKDLTLAKDNAVNELLNSLGLEDKESLKKVVEGYRQVEDSKKDDLEKANELLERTTLMLSNEQTATKRLEAELNAIKAGVRTELSNDFVVIALSKCTKEKDITSVMEEMKKDNIYSMFFSNTNEEKETKQKKNNVTRTRVNLNEKKEETNQEDSKHIGTFAERLLKNKGKVTGHYYKS